MKTSNFTLVCAILISRPFFCVAQHTYGDFEQWETKSFTYQEVSGDYSAEKSLEKHAGLYGGLIKNQSVFGGSNGPSSDSSNWLRLWFEPDSLVFWYKTTIKSSTFLPEIQVVLRSGSGNLWNNIFKLNASDNWTRISLDLSAYNDANLPVYYALNFIGSGDGEGYPLSDSNSLYIDDIYFKSDLQYVMAEGGDFENWKTIQYDVPSKYNAFYKVNANRLIIKSDMSYSGLNSLGLKKANVDGSVTPAILFSENIPIYEKPDSFFIAMAWDSLQTPEQDTASLYLSMLKNNEFIGGGSYNISMKGAKSTFFKAYKLPIYYYVPGVTPDAFNIQFNGPSAVLSPSTTLFLDDMRFNRYWGLGLNEMSLIRQSGYPNPASNTIHFELNGQSENYKYTVVDINGNAVKEGIYYRSNSEHPVLELNVTDLCNGKYLMRIENGSDKVLSLFYVVHQ